MKISVLIPTFSRPDALKTCLKLLTPEVNSIARHEIEVLISDDGPEDISDLIKNFPPAILLRGPKRGPAANRNWLGQNATGDLLIFLDDDCKPCPGLISAYAAGAAEDTSELYEGRILAESVPTRADQECPSNEHGGFFWSANVAIRREAFHSLGGFDEGFPFAAMEDMDLHLRALKRGFKVKWLPEATVIHPMEIRTGYTRLLKSRYSILLYLQKHPEQLEAVRGDFTWKSVLRLIRQRILQRQLIQPLAAYGTLALALRNLLVMNWVLRNPERRMAESRSLQQQLKIRL